MARATYAPSITGRPFPCSPTAARSSSRRPVLRGQGARHRRAVHGPATACVLCVEEWVAPSPAAAAARPDRAGTRLQAQWHDLAVRRPRHRHRDGQDSATGATAARSGSSWITSRPTFRPTSTSTSSWTTTRPTRRRSATGSPGELTDRPPNWTRLHRDRQRGPQAVPAAHRRRDDTGRHRKNGRSERQVIRKGNAAKCSPSAKGRTRVRIGAGGARRYRCPRGTRGTNYPPSGGSCPGAWCKSVALYAVPAGRERDDQAATVVSVMGTPAGPMIDGPLVVLPQENVHVPVAGDLRMSHEQMCQEGTR